MFLLLLFSLVCGLVGARLRELCRLWSNAGEEKQKPTNGSEIESLLLMYIDTDHQQSHYMSSKNVACFDL